MKSNSEKNELESIISEFINEAKEKDTSEIRELLCSGNRARAIYAGFRELGVPDVNHLNRPYDKQIIPNIIEKIASRNKKEAYAGILLSQLALHAGQVGMYMSKLERYTQFILTNQEKEDFWITYEASKLAVELTMERKRRENEMKVAGEFFDWGKIEYTLNKRGKDVKKELKSNKDPSIKMSLGTEFEMIGRYTEFAHNEKLMNRDLGEKSYK